ncbi:MFS transporter [Novispirillum itersonii]|uniref:EmrB/QacA subfamily drug resistance transporter n=1 Tax=Novispirillum itersonii TaxID=189 RepID=A0A7W9ZGM9_NOVIT|nr:MFS transporter [Novispirillum itersonii]MBB6211146.1 EmrB/QacA subfamily drug resistance transporter [Novispirillum itersonii]
MPIAKERLPILLLVLASYLMLVVDVSIVITGLPRIRDSLGFTPAGLSWVHSAYTLTFGGFLLLGARAGDLLGRRRMFLLGLWIFTLTSVVIALAPTAGVMLAGRAVQGLGAAVLAPATLALLTVHFPEGPERTHALSLYGATAGVAASVGLVLGGLLADWVSWRAGFFINLPVGLALIAGTRRYVTETARHSGRFDLPGAVCSTLGMGALVFGLIHAAETGWTERLTLAALGGGGLLLAVLVWHERRAVQPIMPLGLFTDRSRSGALLARMFYLGAMVGMWFFTSQLLQGALGLSASATGVTFLLIAVPQFAGAMAVPRLSRRTGPWPLLMTGMGATLLALASLTAAVDAGAGLPGLALPLIGLGLGQGLTLSPLMVVSVAGIPPERAGAASGLVNAAHQLGGALGLAVLVVVFSHALPADQTGPSALAQRIGAVFLAGTAMLAVATGLIGGLILLRRSGRA